MSEYETSTVKALQALLKSRGLPTAGVKADLIQRLRDNDAEMANEPQQDNDDPVDQQHDDIDTNNPNSIVAGDDNTVTTATTTTTTNDNDDDDTMTSNQNHDNEQHEHADHIKQEEDTTTIHDDEDIQQQQHDSIDNTTASNMKDEDTALNQPPKQQQQQEQQHHTVKTTYGQVKLQRTRPVKRSNEELYEKHTPFEPDLFPTSSSLLISNLPANISGRVLSGMILPFGGIRLLVHHQHQHCAIVTLDSHDSAINAGESLNNIIIQVPQYNKYNKHNKNNKHDNKNNKYNHKYDDDKYLKNENKACIHVELIDEGTIPVRTRVRNKLDTIVYVNTIQNIDNTNNNNDDDCPEIKDIDPTFKPMPLEPNDKGIIILPPPASTSATPSVPAASALPPAEPKVIVTKRFGNEPNQYAPPPPAQKLSILQRFNVTTSTPRLFWSTRAQRNPAPPNTPLADYAAGYDIRLFNTNQQQHHDGNDNTMGNNIDHEQYPHTDHHQQHPIDFEHIQNADIYDQQRPWDSRGHDGVYPPLHHDPYHSDYDHHHRGAYPPPPAAAASDDYYRSDTRFAPHHDRHDDYRLPSHLYPQRSRDRDYDRQRPYDDYPPAHLPPRDYNQYPVRPRGGDYHSHRGGFDRHSNRGGRHYNNSRGGNRYNNRSSRDHHAPSSRDSGANDMGHAVQQQQHDNTQAK